MKPCPYCAEAIQDAAIVCRFCGRDVPASPPPPAPMMSAGTQHRLSAVIIIGLLGALGVAVFAATMMRTTGADPIAASLICQKFVRERLKAPASATFAAYDPERVIAREPTLFVVASSVDSQNAFGANVRTQYTCVVRWLDGTSWRLENLTTQP